MNPRCSLICVGSELLRGKINTHASYIAGRLRSIGLELNEERTVSDEQSDIATAIQDSLGRSDVLFISGGLGPTFDDLTREAVSQATGQPLVLDPALLRIIQAKFRRARYRMPATNARQAYLLEGARALRNDMGTAPGQWLELGPRPEGRAPSLDALGALTSSLGPRRSVLVLLPGPPRELCPMFERLVLPALRRIFPSEPRVETHLHFVGLPESVVDHKVRPIIERYGMPSSSSQPSVQFTILAHPGLVDLDIFVSNRSISQARAVLCRIVRSVQKTVGPAFYGADDDYPLEKVVGDRLRRQGTTLAVAESCTGGMLASRLTDIPGSSDYFVEGIVTYANEAKEGELNVPRDVLAKYGAVSAPTARAMAQGIRARAGTTYGLGITGIAGPTGGRPGKPVGLVYIALASKTGVRCRKFLFTGDRSVVRTRAVIAALDLLRHI